MAFAYVESIGFDSKNDGILGTALGVTPSEYQISSVDEIPVLAA